MIYLNLSVLEKDLVKNKMKIKKYINNYYKSKLIQLNYWEKELIKHQLEFHTLETFYSKRLELNIELIKFQIELFKALPYVDKILKIN